MMYSWLMIRTQVQIPSELYADAKRVAARREISLAELVRRGLEYMIAVSVVEGPAGEWTLPPARSLGGADPCASPGWRADFHRSGLRVAEAADAYPAEKPAGRKKPR